MKIDPTQVRALRDRRAWSQEHLAGVAGVSVRTVQRVESGGGASNETVMALASALGVEPAALCQAPEPQPGRAEGDAPAREARTVLDRHGVLLVGLAIVFLLAFAIAYLVGRDLAHRDNRAECEAAGRSDCR